MGEDKAVKPVATRAVNLREEELGGRGQPGTSEEGTVVTSKPRDFTGGLEAALGSQGHPDSPTSWYDLQPPL